KVIEEADKFKRELNEKGKNARTFSRMLDAMRSFGDLARGVPLQIAADTLFPKSNYKVGGELKVWIREPSPEILALFKGDTYGDSQILMVALDLIREQRRVVLVTKDVSF